MKPVRVLIIALLGYAAVLAPTASQAHGVELSLPGINVRLPVPPFLPIPPLPRVIVQGGGYDSYDREPEYRRMPPPRYYREDWRYEHRDYRNDRRDWDRRDQGDWDRHDRDDRRGYDRDGRR
jgi:hypothetical protein